MSNHEYYGGQEKLEQVAMERARRILPDLNRFHDMLEDRSMMANNEAAEFIARQFTVSVIEVFSDFVKNLEAAKKRLGQPDPEEKS